MERSTFAMLAIQAFGRQPTRSVEELLSENNVLKTENEILKAQIRILKAQQPPAVKIPEPLRIDEEGWKVDPRVVKLLEDEVAQALKEERAKTRQLLRLARRVRNRHMELNRLKVLRNDELINQGNGAAHWGRPAVDASLYAPYTPERYRRTDTVTYSNLYGVKWTTVERLKSCSAFMEMIRTYGTVKGIHPIDFESTEFFKNWPKPGPNFDKMELSEVEHYFETSPIFHKELRARLWVLCKKETDTNRVNRRERQRSQPYLQFNCCSILTKQQKESNAIYAMVSDMSAEIATLEGSDLGSP